MRCKRMVLLHREAPPYVVGREAVGAERFGPSKSALGLAHHAAPFKVGISKQTNAQPLLLQVIDQPDTKSFGECESWSVCQALPCKQYQQLAFDYLSYSLLASCSRSSPA